MMVETPAGAPVGRQRMVELEPSNVAHGGVFVARHEGRVVFVSDAIDGERVLARITDDSHDGYWRAQTVRVLEPSPWRREHVWSAASLQKDPAERAGGAEFGHIELSHQRELKRRVLDDALRRFGHIEHPVSVEAADGDDEAGGMHWRTRVRLHAGAAGVGPYAARSHRVVSVDDLPLATGAVADAAPIGAGAALAAGAQSVDVIAPGLGAPLLLMEGARRDRGRRRRWLTDASGAPVADPTIVEVVAGREFRLDAAGFWQVHHAAAATLHAAVGDAIDLERFDAGAANLDLYGGVGLLAAAVGARAGASLKIATVESYAPATAHAAANLADWPGAEAVTARVDDYLRRTLADSDASALSRFAAATVVLDPPRAGAGRAVVDGLARLHPAQIVYVACDPVALARDLALFHERGYELALLRAFDLFPHTHHLEAVAALRSTVEPGSPVP